MIDLEEIKKELKEISSWPWKQNGHYVECFNNEDVILLGGTYHETGKGMYDNAKFISQAPGRINYLIEIIEKAEKVIKIKHQPRPEWVNCVRSHDEWSQKVDKEFQKKSKEFLEILNDKKEDPEYDKK